MINVSRLVVGREFNAACIVIKSPPPFFATVILVRGKRDERDTKTKRTERIISLTIEKLDFQ